MGYTKAEGENKAMDIKDQELEYKLEDYIEEDEDISYQSVIEWTEEEHQEIVNFFEANLNAIEEERQEARCEERWEQYDNQYWGVVTPSDDLLFNTHVFLTLKHVRTVKNKVMQAFFESDPVIAVSARPGYAGKDGIEAAELQEQFLDYEIDSELIIKEPMGKVFHDAILLDYGVAKVVYEKKEEDIRQKESYKGNQEGLKKFLKEYPDARSKYAKYVNALERGEDITIVAYKKDTVYSAPKIYHVPAKDFYVSLSIDGILGLRDSKFMAERQRYNWYELQTEVEEGRFDKDKVEELQWITQDGKQLPDENLLTREFDVYEIPSFLPVKGKLRRTVSWYSKDRKVILRSINYPYDHNRPYYIPFFISNERTGWLQPGLGRILQPQNIVANAIQNFTLDNAFYRHTPLIRVSPSSPVANQLIAKTWHIGDPLVAEQGEIDKFDLNTGSLGDLFTLNALNERVADDATGAGSSYMSGHADPIDPDAPAKKTMALINETNSNIKSYIMNLLPSFQELAYQILQLFAQYKDEETFAQKRKDVTGKPAMKKITADQLRFRTNLTPNAYSFEFDKVNEKRLNLSLIQVLTGNPFSAQMLQKNPEGAYNLFRNLIKSWSNDMNARVDSIWPTPEKMRQDLVEIQKEAIKQLQAEQAQAQQMQQAMGGQAPVMAGQGGGV